MRNNYLSFLLLGLTAFFIASFFVIFFAASTANEGKEENTTEEPAENEDNNSDSDDDEKEPDNGEDGNNGEESNNGDDGNNEEESDNDDDGNNGEESNNDNDGNNGEESNNGDDGNNEEEEGNNEESEQQLYWGIDSASYTTEDLYACVVDNFGDPEVWGRYLGDREDISAGLDTDEVAYLHENGIPILVIYNHVNDARGYDHGVEHGESAIAMAEELGVPEGVAIFVDIEPNYPVDAAFMEGWYEALEASAYYPAVYGVFDEGSELDESYKAMAEEIQEKMIVWTAFPQEEITTKDNAPEFNPQGPDTSLLYGWQYAIDAETCNIDTNLFTNEMMDYLWQE
ncbi:glycoside hydrolase domain-containing protein [Oceanobacillus bengalensis]|uniref:DUF1906 domain-containing protein n=1 Tax=Oceanobacillus bengalensis TaxID=1435466 RepID=A0A494Z7V1_9BACI|nr:glycoside hydrolase domain-containing protein [Oceanobacillus bengalensis]RKQ18674.1 DUF1906 domain-containing protein [Oceanobacillus bengalensis]